MKLLRLVVRPDELDRIGAIQMILTAALDAGEIADDLAQRRETPAQHDDQQQHQHYAGRAEPDRERAPVHVDLIAQARDVFGDVERQMQHALGARVPVDALREHDRDRRPASSTDR